MANENTPAREPAATEPVPPSPGIADSRDADVDTNVTLTRPRNFCPFGGLVGSRERQWNARTADLLHKRLRALGLLYVIVAGIGHTRELFIDVGFSLTFPLVVWVTVAAFTAYLYREKNPPLLKLRFFEVYFFAAPTATLLYIDHMLMLQSAADPGVMLMNWYRLILHMALLIAGYAMFIPAGWKRTLIATGIMGALPFASLWAMMRSHPEVAAAVQQAMTPEIFTGGVMLAAILVAIAAFGTYTIDSIRHQAAEAGFSGQYQLEKKLGTGGMGEVWLARHRLLTRPTAIKVVRPEFLREQGGTGSGSGSRGSGASSGDPVQTAMKRFEREAQATALLTSPHTIDLYDYGVAQDGTFFYAMEYLDGLDLDTLVDEHGPVPVERAVHLLTQACDSLADAHEHGLIHRDVKPGNIFAARMGIQHDFVKVLDFGLVKDTRPEEGATALTQDGMTSGTPAFMPPEVALAQDNVDERADIYALACVGYWLTTGQYVFVADSPMAMVVDHVKSEPPAPSTRTELAIPPEFDEVILRALAKDPGDRYQNMREFAHALRQVPVRKPWDEARAAEWWQLRNGDAAVAEATTVH
jgi:serine/threonine-protein kinase